MNMRPVVSTCAHLRSISGTDVSSGLATRVPRDRMDGPMYGERQLLISFLRSSTRLCQTGSSGSIVSDYGLNDRAIQVRSPAEAKDFSSSLCAQTGSGFHPASCQMGTGGPFRAGKARPGRDADH
jgi:hypothetical protein